MLSRENKEIIITLKFEQRAYEKCLDKTIGGYESFSDFQAIAKEALRQNGIIIDHPIQANTKKCIFLHPTKGKHYTLLIVEKPRAFIIKSVYPSNAIEIECFRSSIDNLLNGKGEIEYVRGAADA